MAVPRVSVVLSVYNGAAYLRQAMESVAAQTLANFELIVVDNASTDATPAVLDAFHDARLVRLRNAQHLTLAASCNVGLAAARAELIARMDADDVALPARLERQAAAMEANPALVLLGSAVELIDAEGRPLRIRTPPLGDSEVRWHQLFWCGFTHPSVLLRRAALAQEDPGYDPRLATGEDYDLWVRLQRHGRVANLPDVLVRYRQHAASLTARLPAEQEATSLRISLGQLRALCPQLALDEAKVQALRTQVPGLRAGGPDRDPPLRPLLREILAAFAAQAGSDPGFVAALRRFHGL
jgi:glycosyltransferase involved in cell wall biosynthesis